MAEEIRSRFHVGEKVRINLNNISSAEALSEVKKRIDQNGGNIWTIREVVPWGTNVFWYMTKENSFATVWRERDLLPLKENKYQIRGL